MPPPKKKNQASKQMNKQANKIKTQKTQTNEQSSHWSTLNRNLKFEQHETH